MNKFEKKFVLLLVCGFGAASIFTLVSGIITNNQYKYKNNYNQVIETNRNEFRAKELGIGSYTNNEAIELIDSFLIFQYRKLIFWNSNLIDDVNMLQINSKSIDAKGFIVVSLNIKNKSYTLKITNFKESPISLKQDVVDAWVFGWSDLKSFDVINSINENWIFENINIFFNNVSAKLIASDIKIKEKNKW